MTCCYHWIAAEEHCGPAPAFSGGPRSRIWRIVLRCFTCRRFGEIRDQFRVLEICFEDMFKRIRQFNEYFGKNMFSEPETSKMLKISLLQSSTRCAI